MQRQLAVVRIVALAVTGIVTACSDSEDAVDHERAASAARNENRAPTYPRTREYWNAVQMRFLELTLAADRMKSPSFKRIAAEARSASLDIIRMDDDDVSPEAQTACHELSELLSGMAKLLEKSPETPLEGLGVLVNLVADPSGYVGSLRQEGEALNTKFSEFEAEEARAVARINRQLGLDLEPLVPAAVIGLSEFTFSTGYYVNVRNPTRSQSADVTLTFIDRDGKEKVHYVGLLGPSESKRVDPSDFDYRVDPGEKIRVSTPTFDCTFNVDYLIPR